MEVKVLTFGWEFPPHISGGLGTACEGLTKALLEQGTKVLFVVPKAYGDEEINLINASEILVNVGQAEEEPASHSGGSQARVPLEVLQVRSGIVPYTVGEGSRESAGDLTRWNYSPEGSDLPADGRRSTVKYSFSGTYGPSLLEEVMAYAEIGAVIGATYDFDVIHAHDWLTYRAGIAAKRASGKPLIVHVHATEYDRAGEHVDERVVSIEKEGLESADRVVAVSHWTRNIVINKYNIDAGKVCVIHNGVASRKSSKGELGKWAPFRGKNLVTFLGRVTYQKGPAYFVDAAKRVLSRFPDTHFVMAGAGDQLPSMIDLVAKYGISSRFHFTGFLRGGEVSKLWSMTDVYVMPSVSEPFGIAPLEAIAQGVPVIISKQSGVSEVMADALKVDFWDTEALAEAICSLLYRKTLSKVLRRRSLDSLQRVTWESAATKLNQLYHDLIKQTERGIREPVLSGSPTA